uniref:Uncharacterized protein n=1 Tax=Chrysemys picta bellii TaxID=8478 RepID=A0A8C3P920_CHRPI
TFRSKTRHLDTLSSLQTVPTHMGMYLARFTPVPDTCPFCGVRKTLAHVYLECARLQPRFRLLLDIWLHF